MDRGDQPARRTGDDAPRDEHDPAPADAGACVLSEAHEPGAAAGIAAVVRVALGIDAIRARFAGERPPVSDDEWDGAAYAEQRIAAYREALEKHPQVRVLRVTPATATPTTQVSATVHCPWSGDLVCVEFVLVDASGDPARSLRDAIDRAVQRVLADRGAWRRHLLPVWFERHRAWRAQAGSPLQH